MKGHLLWSSVGFFFAGANLGLAACASSPLLPLLVCAVNALIAFNETHALLAKLNQAVEVNPTTKD